MTRKMMEMLFPNCSLVLTTWFLLSPWTSTPLPRMVPHNTRMLIVRQYGFQMPFPAMQGWYGGGRESRKPCSEFHVVCSYAFLFIIKSAYRVTEKPRQSRQKNPFLSILCHAYRTFLSARFLPHSSIITAGAQRTKYDNMSLLGGRRLETIQLALGLYFTSGKE